MQKREAKSSIVLRHWLMANPLKFSCTFEMKDSGNGFSIPFSCVQDNQLAFSTAIVDSPKGVLIRNQGGNGEPDYTYHYQQPAWIAIKFPNSIEIIAIAGFLMEKKKSIRKSLTSTRAKEISTYSISLNKKTP